VPPAEHGPIMDVKAMARAASSTADAEEHAGDADAANVKSSTAVPGAPFGDFTPDEEKRFLASADGDKVEAMRRYKAALVRTKIATSLYELNCVLLIVRGGVTCLACSPLAFDTLRFKTFDIATGSHR